MMVVLAQAEIYFAIPAIPNFANVIVYPTEDKEVNNII